MLAQQTGLSTKQIEKLTSKILILVIRPIKIEAGISYLSNLSESQRRV